MSWASGLGDSLHVDIGSLVGFFPVSMKLNFLISKSKVKERFFMQLLILQHKSQKNKQV